MKLSIDSPVQTILLLLVFWHSNSPPSAVDVHRSEGLDPLCPVYLVPADGASYSFALTSSVLEVRFMPVWKNPSFTFILSHYTIWLHPIQVGYSNKNS